MRTYAPRGQTPILTLPLSRDHLAAISGVTRQGRLCLRLQDAAVRGPDCVAFLRQLARAIRGLLLVVWDGATIHRAQPVKDFLRTRTGRRFRLETLPGYAPELNPVEQLWGNLKGRELANMCAPDLHALHGPLRAGCRRVRQTAALPFSFLRHAGLAFTR